MTLDLKARNTVRLQLAEDTLREFGQVRFVAQGSSMMPAIYPGDWVVVEALADSPPCSGEVVLCRHGDGFRVHRLARLLEARSDTLCVLRGDALTEDDPPVPASQLLGRVRFLVRRGKVVNLRPNVRIRQRVKRFAIRNSRIAAVLLHRWNQMRAGTLMRNEPRRASSFHTKTESV